MIAVQSVATAGEIVLVVMMGSIIIIIRIGLSEICCDEEISK